jgi:hypothetical protein
VSGPDASWHEMPGIPLPSWLGAEPDEPLLDMVLAGKTLPGDAPQGIVTMADGLANLAAPAGPGELPGEAAALTAFKRSVSPGGLSPGPEAADPRRRRRVLVAGRARLAAALAAVGVVLGGTAAAYAGALPAPIQDLAHHVLGAPAAHRGSDDHPRLLPSHTAEMRARPGHAVPRGVAKGRGKNSHPVHPGKPVRQRKGGHGRNPKKSSRLNR